MKPVIYFGAIGRPGHYFHGAGDAYDPPAGCPWRHVDGTLAPGAGAHWRERRPQNEGEAAIHHKDGWTALAFWDRSVDGRTNSNSVFLAPGTHDFDAMVALSREAWPQVWARFRFDVRPA